MVQDRAITKAVSVVAKLIEFERDRQVDAVIQAAFSTLGSFGRFAKSRLEMLTKIVVNDPKWSVWAMDAMGSIMRDVTRDVDVAEDLEEWKARTLTMFNELLDTTNVTDEHVDELRVRLASCEEELGLLDATEDEADEEEDA